MTEAVIVSTARTPLCKSWRGAFNMTHGATMGGHALQHGDRARAARSRRGRRRDHGLRQPGRRDRPQHRAADRDARRLPGHRPGHDREPLLLVGPADDRASPRSASWPARATSIAAGGVESISCVQNEMNKHMLNEDWLLQRTSPSSTGRCCRPPRHVAKSYGISREQQDRYGVRSQQRAAAAREAGKFTRRDRADDDDDEGRRQGDRRGVDQGGDGRRRTKASAPTRPTRACRRSSRRSKAASSAAGNASQFSDGAAALRRDERQDGASRRA